MTKPHVSRRDISLTEQVETDVVYTRTTWEAALFGRLSTGEHVDLTRTAPTYAEALADLEAAINDLGWEIL
ncbi:hypothetical protein [Agromyces larvae]|uniref:Uncharacterized protein n=1 Tax=Agromyces larvae TaxID=2929802 RepID=A0ABY4C6Z4_9MICO|nr:hypothetical protein [Agromyces larvae]UOE45961.1 hypothetical protein MTO99_09530 [Agromyces larvae]